MNRLSFSHHPITARVNAKQKIFDDTTRPRCPQPLAPNNDVCSVCKGAGFLRHNVPYGHPAFGKISRCMCTIVEEKKRTRERAYTWMGASEDEVRTLESMTFQTFDRTFQPEAYDKAREYARQARANLNATPNFVFAGSNGTGKTHLATSILNELRDAGFACLFTTAAHFFQVLHETESQVRLITQAAQADILCLDDLDKLHVREGGEYQKKMLFELINRRYTAHKPTIITTNVCDKLDKWLEKGAISRLIGNGYGHEMHGQDCRFDIGKEKIR